ncbi:MAG: translation elongation factor 4 [Candidatus Porifericomitaceae bacterium WSBS_2022_MAG_OTU9]
MKKNTVDITDTPQSNIRNFSIIAHIDHGKSTLADRLIESCSPPNRHKMGSQVLDTMELERERGITIKAQSASLSYKAAGTIWQLNLIDTPGHVDFSYEVSRSLAACEGAVLVVDASQGVEAQSIATCMIALENNVVVLPVLNKMDLDSVEPDKVREQITELLGLDASKALGISAKTGLGVGQLLQDIVSIFPPPSGSGSSALQALIIDSWFDPYHGVVSLVRIMNGTVAVGDKIRVLSKNKDYQVLQLGIFTPASKPCKKLRCGEVGFLIMGVKQVDAVPVGDTITVASEIAAPALAGFCTVQPRVFAGIFPSDSGEFEGLREALAKISLNDAALQYEAESSQALGFGFRCGFLGTLHIDIIRERLEREYKLDLLVTPPTVIYEWRDTSGVLQKIDNPGMLPSPDKISELREPIVSVDIYVPQQYVGAVMELCLGKRGSQRDMRYIGKQVQLTFEMPLSEVVLDFFDKLKSISSGYASFDYEFLRYQAANLVRVDLVLNGAIVDSMSFICHRGEAAARGRSMVRSIKNSLSRHMFEIAIQAVIGAKVIARESVSALRKNVTAKCYGGDVSRKRKLLEKQKEGKKRMKQFGSVQLPQEALLSALKTKRN